MDSGNSSPVRKIRPTYIDNWLVVSLAVLAACMPIWILPIPVSADLPQHLLQLKLLATPSSAGPELQHAPWFYPNTLVYYLSYPIWLVSSPIDAGRWILTLLSTSWILSIAFLAHGFNRPIENALIAAPLVFCFLVSWGFLNFLIGWPIFCVFIWTSTQVRTPFRKFSGMLLLGAALYLAHALWFAAGNLWLALNLLRGKKNGARDWWMLATCMLPAWIAATAWYPQMTFLRQESDVDIGIHWDLALTDRLSPSNLSDAMFGTIYGPFELCATTLLLGWLGLSLVKPGRPLSTESDANLFLAGSLMVLGYLLLPDRYMNTLYFNSRWMPFGMTLLLLSLPAPRISRPLAWGLPLALMCSLSVLTAREYRTWSTESLDGFFESLESVTPDAKLLTLNFSSASENVKGVPGIHLFAWAQLLRSAQVHFSFAEHHAAILHSLPGFQNPSRKLVWFPAAVDKSLATHYDLILIHGNETLHAVYQRKLDLEPVTAIPTRWRLYRQRIDSN